MKAISLGWGVQSFTLAAMAALGELEPVDVAIHADTTHESKLTYEFAAPEPGQNPLDTTRVFMLY